MTPTAGAPVVFVTGTDTGVGKTVATAAIAVALATRSAHSTTAGTTVAVDKPTQTGMLPGEPGDIQEVQRLAGVDSVTEGIRLRAAMAPVAAAAREAAALPTVHEHAARIRRLSQIHDRVLVEGAGGLLVQLDGAGRTLADLAATFASQATVIVVCRSGLNHTELTLEALSRRGLHIAGLIIGSWPHHPDDIDLDNSRYLSSLGIPLLGAVPQDSSLLDPYEFRARAPAWLRKLT
jgi:dethiobiotin synthetase